MKKGAKLPTLFGITILVLGLVAGVYLINSRKIFKLGAQTENSPKDVRIGNIAGNSMTITWTTDIQSKGFIKWNKQQNNLSKIALEQGDTDSIIHLVNILGIDPNSDVYFKINSGGKDFDNNGLPWQSKTLIQNESSISPLTATGVILEQDGNTPASAIVNLIIDGKTLSTITSKEGSWVIPVSNYLNSINDSTIIQIEINAGMKGTAQATIYPTAIKNTPVILLGKTYDFRTLTEEDIKSLPQSKLSIPELVQTSSRFVIDKTNTNTIQQGSVTLDSISEGETINTQDPEFFGKAPKNVNIQILVESDLQSAIILPDNSGGWKWSPPNNLEAGEHKVTVKWTDVNGIARTITRSFVVSASEGPAFVSTPSATLKSTSTPTARTTSSPVSTATAKSTTTSTPEPLPETGYVTNTLAMFILGLGLLLTSIYVNNKNIDITS